MTDAVVLLFQNVIYLATLISSELFRNSIVEKIFLLDRAERQELKFSKQVCFGRFTRLYFISA